MMEVVVLHRQKVTGSWALFCSKNTLLNEKRSYAPYVIGFFIYLAVTKAAQHDSSRWLFTAKRSVNETEDLCLLCNNTAGDGVFLSILGSAEYGALCGSQ